jgi:hypothetical protein
MQSKPCLLLAALLPCALAVPTAEAAITPTLVAVVPNADGTFTFTYNVDLAEDQNAASDGAFPSGSTPTGPGAPSSAFQDYFVIYDFVGLVSGSWTQPAGWTPGSAFTGPTPSTTTPSDDPGRPNVYWVRTGEPDLTGPQDLGNFSVRSIFVNVWFDNYASDATRSQGQTTGTAVASIGTANVPQVSGGCPFVVGGPCDEVSEPRTLLMLASGLLSLALYTRMKAG